MNRMTGAALLLVAVLGCFAGFAWHASVAAYALFPVSVLLGAAGSVVLTAQPPTPPLVTAVPVPEPLATPEPHSNLRLIPPVR